MVLCLVEELIMEAIKILEHKIAEIKHQISALQNSINSNSIKIEKLRVEREKTISHVNDLDSIIFELRETIEILRNK